MNRKMDKLMRQMDSKNKWRRKTKGKLVNPESLEKPR